MYKTKEVLSLNYFPGKPIYGSGILSTRIWRSDCLSIGSLCYFHLVYLHRHSHLDYRCRKTSCPPPPNLLCFKRTFQNCTGNDIIKGHIPIYTNYLDMAETNDVERSSELIDLDLLVIHDPRRNSRIQPTLSTHNQKLLAIAGLSQGLPSGKLESV
jgi:hypothetical protein